jgi:hypothetical protein
VKGLIHGGRSDVSLLSETKGGTRLNFLSEMGDARIPQCLGIGRFG